MPQPPDTGQILQYAIWSRRQTAVTGVVFQPQSFSSGYLPVSARPFIFITEEIHFGQLGVLQGDDVGQIDLTQCDTR